jgi:hypothetical protein
MPKLRRFVLADAEIIRATARIPRILPQRLNAQMKQMNRISQLQALKRDIVKVLIELLDADDLVTQRLRAIRKLLGSQVLGVGGGGRRRCLLLAPFRPELPAEAEFGHAHGFEDVV